MKEIVFLTGNNNKMNRARVVFKKYPDVHITNLEVETVEIQSLDVVKVAEFVVKEASSRLNLNVFKMDSGYYFEGLNGFPGALVKYFNNAFSSEDILRMLEGKSHNVVIRECLSYCEPNCEPVSFVASVVATISSVPQGEGSSIDRIIMYDGFQSTQANSKYEDVLRHWNENLDHYKQFAEYVSKI